MNFRAIIACSILALAAGSLMSSCNSSGNSQPVTTSVAQSIVTATPDNPQAETNLIARPPKGESYVSGQIRFVAVEVTEKNVRYSYDLDISYPQIDNPRTTGERRFNFYVRQQMERHIKEFKVFCSKNRRYPNGKERDME